MFGKNKNKINKMEETFQPHLPRSLTNNKVGKIKQIKTKQCTSLYKLYYESLIPHP